MTRLFPDLYALFVFSYHQVIDHQGWSKKGQSPFILFNGEEIPDSNFTIEYLCKYFKKEAYPGVSELDKAVARAFLKMMEENTTW